MQARDLMSEEVIVIQEDTPLEEVLDLFLLKQISGAPVVDKQGRFVGVISQQDLLFGQMTMPAGTITAEVGLNREGYYFKQMTAREIMTSPAVCATEDTDVEELARIMWRLHIHRLPIVRDGRVKGVVSSMDLCRIISEKANPPKSAIA